MNFNWFKKKKIRYTALFVEDVSDLLKRFPPKHEVIFGHHSTISFEPKDINNIEVGKKYKVKIIGRAFDEIGDDLLIENHKSENIYPHITISRPKDAPKLYSKELFKKAVQDESIEYFDDEYVNVIEGYSDGKNIYI